VSVDHLLRHYGTEAAGIFNLGGADRRLFRRLLAPHPAIEAEVVHAVRRSWRKQWKTSWSAVSISIMRTPTTALRRLAG